MAETLTAEQVTAPWALTTSIKLSDLIPFIPSTSDGTNGAQKITAELFAVYIWKMHPPKVENGVLKYYDMSTGTYTSVGEFSEKSYTFEVDSSKKLIEYINKGATDEQKIEVCDLASVFADLAGEAKTYEFAVDGDTLYYYINKGLATEQKIKAFVVSDLLKTDALKTTVRADVYAGPMTQAEYDALVTANTVDTSLIYLINET
jgi:hypothetical protein